MTEAEICRSYRNAINRNMQLQILSDLTGHSKIEVIKILLKNGEELPKRCINQLFARLDKLDAEISAREKEYLEIVDALRGGAKASVSQNSKGEINVERTETRKQKLME